MKKTVIAIGAASAALFASCGGDTPAEPVGAKTPRVTSGYDVECGRSGVAAAAIYAVDTHKYSGPPIKWIVWCDNGRAYIVEK